MLEDDIHSSSERNGSRIIGNQNSARWPEPILMSRGRREIDFLRTIFRMNRSAVHVLLRISVITDVQDSGILVDIVDREETLTDLRNGMRPHLLEWLIDYDGIRVLRNGRGAGWYVLHLAARTDQDQRKRIKISFKVKPLL